MTHVRTQVRNYIVGTTLLSLRSQTEQGVIHNSRGRPVGKYPSINVHNGSERVVVENPGYVNADKVYQRFQDFVIEIAVLDPDEETAAKELDTLCQLVEDAMGVDESLGGGVIATDLFTTTFNQFGTGTEALHIALLTYRCEYRTEGQNADTLIR